MLATTRWAGDDRLLDRCRARPPDPADLVTLD
jgi:hypothetical protein